MCTSSGGIRFLPACRPATTSSSIFRLLLLTRKNDSKRMHVQYRISPYTGQARLMHPLISILHNDVRSPRDTGSVVRASHPDRSRCSRRPSLPMVSGKVRILKLYVAWRTVRFDKSPSESGKPSNMLHPLILMHCSACSWPSESGSRLKV